MMDYSKPYDGGPAYPGPQFSEGGHHTGHAMGVSLRDWFAGQAPITIANACSWCGYENIFEAMNTPSQCRKVFSAMAALRFAYADAMISARDAKGVIHETSRQG